MVAFLGNGLRRCARAFSPLQLIAQSGGGATAPRNFGKLLRDGRVPTAAADAFSWEADEQESALSGHRLTL